MKGFNHLGNVLRQEIQNSTKSPLVLGGKPKLLREILVL